MVAPGGADQLAAGMLEQRRRPRRSLAGDGRRHDACLLSMKTRGARRRRRRRWLRRRRRGGEAAAGAAPRARPGAERA